MSMNAVVRAAALLHGVHERCTHPDDFATRAAIIAWLISPPGLLPLADTHRSTAADLREALRLLVDDVTHDDLPVDVLVTARRWLDQLLEDDLRAATP